MRTLKEGTRGPDVTAWQRFLAARGFYTGKLDGEFGPKTTAATKAFQSAEGLKPDGIVGKMTLGRAGLDGHRTLRRLDNKELTPAIIAEAVRILGLHKRDPYGTEIPTTIDGEPFVARIEEHFHPHGGKARPWGYHAGVSMFAVVSAEIEDVEDEPDDYEADTVPAPPPEPATPQRFRLGASSRKKLEGVHPDLVRVIERAIEISPVDFAVIDGLRTLERQKQLKAQGASKTLNSRHLTGHAVDIAPFVDGKVSWHWPQFHELAPTIKQAAAELGIKIEWGGDWASFPDGPHWQLSREVYP